MEEPLSIRRELPGEPPQLTSCKKCLLITKVQIRSALKTESTESLNRSRALTFRLGRNGGLLSLYNHRLVNLQSGRGNGHAEFSLCCFFLLIAHKYEYKTRNTKSHFGTKAPLPRNLAVCDFTTRASCLGFLRSPPMLRDVPPRAFMCSARARIKQASVVGSCVCESEREQQLPVFLSPSCCIRLSCAIWMDVVELRRWSSETLLFHFLSRFLTTRCQSAVWQRWWCGEDAPVVRMTQTQRNSQSRLIHK
ncbi:hypothetical protein Q8A67_020222 [Cirrhinus molitorella]|uniref:Uncharacterized protein n=1 Tax=Cirrhinus molitorella TaxID=172907 RepID=A0AA88TGS2_9TELE|nr:hypothetical protein Q8A67_020222 [Cirrhinus molitorella]